MRKTHPLAGAITLRRVSRDAGGNEGLLFKQLAEGVSNQTPRSDVAEMVRVRQKMHLVPGNEKGACHCALIFNFPDLASRHEIRNLVFGHLYILAKMRLDKVKHVYALLRS